MNELLARIIEAHGGLKRWQQFSQLSANVVVGGLLWGLKGQQDFVRPTRLTADLHRQKASQSPFVVAGQQSSVEP
jgi:hypothetical protein